MTDGGGGQAGGLNRGTRQLENEEKLIWSLCLRLEEFGKKVEGPEIAAPTSEDGEFENERGKKFDKCQTIT